jgi:hypothetical protein
MLHALSCGVPIDTVLEARPIYEARARAEQAHLERQSEAYRAARPKPRPRPRPKPRPY